MFSQQVTNVRNQDDRGAVLVEYAALVMLVVVVAIATLSAFGVSILELYSDNTERFTGAVQRNVG